MHDENYKRLFAFPRMVEDLLRVVVTSEWIEAVDFSTLRKLSAEFVSDELRRRHGDTVWRLRLGDGWLHVLVLLEFQSRNDPEMALRILEYTVLLYRELSRNEDLGRDGLRPPVLPVVLYNGVAPWTAPREARELISPAGPFLSAYQPSQRYLVLDERHVEEDDLPSRNLVTSVVGLEQSRSASDLVRVARVLHERLQGPRDGELRRAFGDWIRTMMERLKPEEEEGMPREQEWEEEEGMTLVERVAQWPKEWLAQGREEGREEGLEHERALLCRQAASRFGADTSRLLSAALARVADPDRLADIGEWLVRCETGEEFLARVAPAAGPPE